MQSVYKSGQYLEKQPTWHSEYSLWKARQITRVLSDEFLAENFGNRKLSMVDIGCGVGGVLGYLREILLSKGYEPSPCKGIDIADEALEMARRKWPDIEFLNCDLAELGRHFDIGLLVDVIEHLEDTSAFLSSCSYFCDYLLLHILLEDKYNSRLGNKYQSISDKVAHIHYFDYRSALSFLGANDPSLLESKFTKGFLSSERTTTFAKLALPVRLILSFISEPLCAKILGGMSLIVLTKCPQKL